MNETTDKCFACPECDCEEYEYENFLGKGFRCCKSCGQEWWIDIDYAEARATRNKIKADEKPLH